MDTVIYRLNGEYFGFICNDALFDKHSNYLGWVDSDVVFTEDGMYLGEIVNENYIMKSRSNPLKCQYVARVIPATPALREPFADKVPMHELDGLVDSLNEY